MINAFQDGWNHFSKPGHADYNRWWNSLCQDAKCTYEANPTHDSHHAFLTQCRLAKKEYFAQKVEDMVRSQKPWEGTGWIKQCALPKVPQIVTNGQVLNDLSQMFDKMHDQFAHLASTPAESGFVDGLPQWPT